MSGSDEVAITSESSGQLWNACIWNPRAGTSLMTYKGGGVASPHSLCLLGTDYLMMSDHAKPVLHAWQLNSQQPVSAQGIRLVCPGRVSCMAITPSGTYCVTAIAEKLHVWLLCSGVHLAVAVRHYKPVTCIRFTDDGSHFVSAGEDGLVLVWPLSKLVSRNPGDIPANQVEPRYTFHDHVVPVSDVYVGPGRMRARLMTVSVDRTCKIYDLSTGVLILSLIFDCPLTAVTADSTELEVFVGGKNGTIYQFGLHSPPRMREYYLTKEQHSKSFLGHTKAITSLSSSKDGSTLLSGSLDASVMLWHIPSRQCIRVLKHNGPVTNAFFAFIPKNVFLEERKPTQVLSSIQRNLDNDEKKMMCIVRTQKDVRPKKDDEEEFESYKYRPIIVRDRVEDNGLKDQIAELKKINHELFEFAKNNILQSAASNQEIKSKSELENANDLPSSKTFLKGIKKMKKRKRAGQESDYY